MKFYRLEELYSELPVWKSVPEVERREIYVDVQHNLAKKEKEEAKALTKRNKKRLGEILDQVSKLGLKRYICGSSIYWGHTDIVRERNGC